jgi:hypothetical protein
MAERSIQGRFTVSTTSDLGGGSWNFVGQFVDNYGKWTATDIQTAVGLGTDFYVYVMSPFAGDVDRYRVVTVNSASGLDLNVDVTYDDDGSVASPGGVVVPNNFLLAEKYTNSASMTPVMISANIDERIYNYARNQNDKLTSSPADTVTAETSYGQGSASGSAETFSRSDHTHGTPDAQDASEVSYTNTTSGLTATDVQSAIDELDSAIDNIPDIATTVTAETSYGQSSAVGTATDYAREDHTHGTPDAQDASEVSYTNTTSGLTATDVQSAIDELDSTIDGLSAIPDPATTVTAETSFGVSSAVGTATDYSREDHTHGTPATPITQVNEITGGQGTITGALTLTAGTNVTLTQSGNSVTIASSSSGGGAVQYNVESTSGEEVDVLATNTGITYSRTGNVGTFVVPAGVRLLSFRARIPASAKTANSFVFDVGSGGVMGNNDATDRWIPAYAVCDESTGNAVFTNLNMNLSNFSRFSILNMSSSTTDLVVCSF